MKKDKGVENMKPLISIIIPNYNREKVICETVENVLEQTYENIEVIVVDDCSEDNSVKLLGTIRDQRVRVLTQKQHQGQCKSRNLGVKASSGMYIAFQDSGTVWEKDKLEKQAAILQEQESVGMVYCTVEIDNGTGATRFPSAIAREWKEEKCLETLRKGNIIDTPTMVMRKECFEQLEGFDEQFLCWEDYDFVIRFAQKYPIRIVDEVLVHSRYFENSISKNDKLLLQTLPVFLKKHYLFWGSGCNAEELLRIVFNGILRNGKVTHEDFLVECQNMHNALSKTYGKSILKSAECALEEKRAIDSMPMEIVKFEFQNFMKEVHEGKQFYIYGAGTWAARLIKRFDELGYIKNIKNLIVSKKGQNKSVEGIEILSLDELKNEQNVPILIGVAEKTQLEIYKILRQAGCIRIVIFYTKFWEYIK